MAHKGKKLLAVVLAAAFAAPVPGAFAQVRAAAGAASVPGLASSLGAAASAPSAALTPSLTAGPLAAPALLAAPASLAAPLPAASIPAAAPLAAPAPAAAPAAAPAFAAARGAVAAPSEGPRTPKSGEAAKAAADGIFDASKPADEAAATPVAGRESVSAPALKPAGTQGQAAASIFDPGPRTASLPDQVRDRLRYTKLLSRSFWWYMYTHIGDMWPGYKARAAKARAEGPVAVSRTRDFFTSMRVTGMSGRFYALGGSALEDDLVIAEFRRSFATYFDGPGIGAPQRAALERFMARAKTFNAEKRAHTNMYKNIRDPLLKASTMRPDQLVAYFDSLLPPEKENAIKEFQTSGRMDAVREKFLGVLRATLDEEDPADPHRVRAAIVLGSFASGSAGPGSDFDVEALVNGASNARLPAFMKRLTERWTAAGFHKTNPVTVHDNASWPSWGLVNIIQTRHYLVVSPEPALVARLSRQAFEDPATVLERGYTVRGRVNRVAQRALVATATYMSDLKAALGVKSAPSGH
jgi:hypothetical protein